MGRDLDPTYATGLAAPTIMPVRLVELDLNSGTQYVWSGVGPLTWNGKTFSGVGSLGEVGPITEGTGVEAHGTYVKLSGIALSDIDWPPEPANTPSPPVTVPSGQSVAWAIAQVAPAPDTFSNSPSIWNGGLGCSGSASGTVSDGLLTMLNGQSLFGQNSVGLTWQNYKRPPQIPAGAPITAVYPVVDVTALSLGGDMTIGVNASGGSTGFGPGGGLNVGPNIGSPDGAYIYATIQNTVPGAASLGMTFDFVGMAVYYVGSPLAKASLLYEAMSDVHVGGTARIWRGLMQDGQLLGVPYQAFRGYIDTVSVDVSGETSAITLNLESKIVDLARACYRRYTTPDQRLYFPTDIGCNWMEILQDIALKTGT